MLFLEALQAHHAQVENIFNFLVEDLGGQAKSRNVVAHQAPGDALCLENRALITQWHQIIGHGEARTTRADQSQTFAVLLLWDGRQAIANVLPVIGRHSFQAAD